MVLKINLILKTNYIWEIQAPSIIKRRVFISGNTDTVTKPSITTPPPFDDAKYELLRNLKCDNSTGLTQHWDTYEAAFNFCEKYDPENCKGIHDQFCDGTSILTCGKLVPADDTSSSSNGCTYVKKGRQTLSSPEKLFYCLNFKQRSCVSKKSLP